MPEKRHEDFFGERYLIPDVCIPSNEFRFNSQDIYALQQLERITDLMDRCLDGQVKRTLRQFFGEPKDKGNRFTELQKKYRYVQVVDFEGAIVGCGFHLTNGESPYITVSITVDLRHFNLVRVNKVAEEFQRQYPEWKVSEPPKDKVLFRRNFEMEIFQDIDLLSFLTRKNQIYEISEWMKLRLEELYSLKKELCPEKVYQEGC